MKCTVQIEDIKTINEIEGAWSHSDYIELLDRMNFPDAEKLDSGELREMLFLAVSDFEPGEAAEIVLTYKLSDLLSEGQIRNIAFEMIEDKVAEEYSDISLHHQLFDVNQLLFKAYNGVFPNIKASSIKVKLEFHPKVDGVLSKEMVLKALCNGVSERNLITRLFDAQLKGEMEFKEADAILWKLEKLADGNYLVITSDYWLNEDDFTSESFEGSIREYEPELT